jgi:Homoserine dehydrogenase
MTMSYSIHIYRKLPMINVALLGHGVVGSGVAELLCGNADIIKSRLDGRQIYLKYILDLREFPNSPYKEQFTKDFDIILNDPSVAIVAECMGGVLFAYEAARRCLVAGKSFITSNKELVAAHGAELLALAIMHRVLFLFEASVGGGIPIIRPIARCLAANNVEKISGILNGTTNYILEQMFAKGVSFDSALADAQALGYAEKDPSADVDGLDAGRKIAILSSLACGKHVYPDKVFTKGIRDITSDDITSADKLGFVIKLIGSYKKRLDGLVEVSCEPTFVKKDTALSVTNGVYNGVVVTGDAVDDVTFIGRGAGKMPTASAVVADIIGAARGGGNVMCWTDSDGSMVAPYESYLRRWYVDGEITEMQTRPKGKRVFPILD